MDGATHRSRARWLAAAGATLAAAACEGAPAGEGSPPALAAETETETIDPAALPAEESGLPILHLYQRGAIGDDYGPVDVVYRGHRHQAKAKLRGTSSRGYPKKNFTLKFRDDDPFSEPDRGEGFVSRRKLVLFGGFDDNSQLRTRLAFEVWNRLQRGALRLQSYHAVVYLDGKYHGLYLVADHVDEDFFAERGAGEGGQLFKAVSPNATFASVDDLDVFYEKKAGLPEAGEPGAFDDLAALARLVALAEDAEFQVDIGRKIDLGSYGSWFILASAIQAADTFGKNTYQYRPADGGRWRIVPWDFNHAFGQDWSTFREAPSAIPTEQAVANRLLDRLLAHGKIGPKLRARYASALVNEIALESLLGLVDAWAGEIAEAAARDEARWRSAYLGFERWASRTDFTDFTGEVAYLKTWLGARWAFLRGRFAPPS